MATLVSYFRRKLHKIQSKYGCRSKIFDIIKFIVTSALPQSKYDLYYLSPLAKISVRLSELLLNYETICFFARYCCINISESTHQEHCIKPVIMDAAFIPERDFYQVNETVQVKCHDDDVGQLFIKCHENGLWSSNVSCKGMLK